MRRSNGVINRLINWLFGELLSKEYFPSVDKYEDLEVKEVRRIAEFCMLLLIILTTLYIFGGNFLSDVSEPQWWILFEDWLLEEVMLIK